MNKDILKKLLTPDKHGKLVLAPSYKKGVFDGHAIDCPFPFRHNGMYYMVFIGWDGVGYQNGLASSLDMVISIDIPMFNTPLGGLRVEDGFLVTRSGAERLNKTPYIIKK